MLPYLPLPKGLNPWGNGFQIVVKELYRNHKHSFIFYAVEKEQNIFVKFNTCSYIANVGHSGHYNLE